ncbi:universal stress protein [Muribaculaceae bacterium Isolate-002 (NCI)]|nr:universal stress protein [Muribaculaceae bacterium Isolate-002 (NCI)]
MEEDRLITVAIHTYDHAVALKNMLEREGVSAVLHNVNLSTPVVSSGVRVRIKEADLPQALRIIENSEIFAAEKDCAKSSTNSEPVILVPVDFSDYSMKAAVMAFDIAYRHKAHIMLLHSFINPALSKRVQLTDSFSFELAESQEVGNALMRAARITMDLFESQLRERIKNGEIPPVKFSNLITEGVPEDVINETAKSVSPILIVMGTRGAERKEEELIGSVTAEVLDSCKFPVFSIPENITLEHISDISHLLFFSNLEQEDLLALEAIYRLFKNAPIEITIVHIPGKKELSSSDRRAIKSLVEYCRNHYPSFTFNSDELSLGNLGNDYRRIAREHQVNLVALPNKKRNVFFRFFNPSLAHKLLLHADISMLVIPV